MARPLQRKMKLANKHYKRPAHIEAAIDKAMLLDDAEIRRRAKIANSSSPDYLQEECIVHLMRESYRNGKIPTYNALVQVLLGRCEANLRTTVANNLPDAEGIREQILSDFGIKLATVADPASTELDYFECRFRKAFRSIRVNRVNAETSYYDELAPVPDETDGDTGEAVNYEEVLARMSGAAIVKANQEDAVRITRLMKLVNRLPPELRRVVILCRILGLDDESKDLKKETAATICGCSGRMIRYRLAKADEQLKEFKEEEL